MDLASSLVIGYLIEENPIVAININLSRSTKTATNSALRTSRRTGKTVYGIWEQRVRHPVFR